MGHAATRGGLALNLLRAHLCQGASITPNGTRMRTPTRRAHIAIAAVVALGMAAAIAGCSKTESSSTADPVQPTGTVSGGDGELATLTNADSSNLGGDLKFPVGVV